MAGSGEGVSVSSAVVGSGGGISSLVGEGGGEGAGETSAPAVVAMVAATEAAMVVAAEQLHRAVRACRTWVSSRAYPP